MFTCSLVLPSLCLRYACTHRQEFHILLYYIYTYMFTHPYIDFMLYITYVCLTWYMICYRCVCLSACARDIQVVTCTRDFIKYYIFYYIIKSPAHIYIGLLYGLAVKNLPAMQWRYRKHEFNPGWRSGEGMATHSVLCLRIPWQRSLAGYSPESQRARHDWKDQHAGMQACMHEVVFPLSEMFEHFWSR